MIDCLDHCMLTTAQPEEPIRFPTEVPGMTLEYSGNGRRALKFGRRKTNIPVMGRE